MADKKYDSETGGVIPMNIEGKFHDQRERLRGMTDEDRRLRLQFQKDQLLSPNEPRIVPELYLELVNPIRRFLRWPLDTLFEKSNVAAKIGLDNAQAARMITGRLMWAVAFGYWTTYYFMYNSADWTTSGRWALTWGREQVLPGDPGYPRGTDRKNFNDHYDRGFKNSPI